MSAAKKEKPEFPQPRTKLIDGVPHIFINYVSSCSGCHETNEGYEIYQNGKPIYAYDEKNRIFLGSGCHECGYTGKRRHRFWMPENPEY